MMDTIHFDSFDTKALARLGIVTIGGVLGIYVAILAGQTAIQGVLTRPDDDLLFPVLGAYAFALGGWCGWSGRTSNSTVLVSLGFVIAYVLLVAVLRFVNPAGYAPDSGLRFLALFLVMLLGVVQAVSLVGYWIGKALPN